MYTYIKIKFQLDNRYKAFALKESRDIKKKLTSLQIEIHNIWEKMNGYIIFFHKKVQKINKNF